MVVPSLCIDCYGILLYIIRSFIFRYIISFLYDRGDTFNSYNNFIIQAYPSYRENNMNQLALDYYDYNIITLQTNIKLPNTRTLDFQPHTMKSNRGFSLMRLYIVV